jgi:hypothetical protein
MNINKQLVELICELEYIVGQECFNPNSYNGYTGEEGKDFRYPVWAKNKNTEVEKKFMEKFLMYCQNIFQVLNINLVQIIYI